jgi:serpin B
VAPERVAEEDVKAAAQGVNAFTIDVYRFVAEGSGNRIVSPASIAIALAMTMPGARGKTEQEIQSALHLSVPEDVRGLAGLLTAWNARPVASPADAPADFELDVANRLFGAKNVDFRPEYVQTTARLFGAPLEPVDFAASADGARVRINGWVEQQTHDKIEDLIPPGGVTTDTRLVLVNAVYFKAQWMEPFSEHATADADFWSGGTQKIKVPMMQRTEHYAYAEPAGADVQVVQIPYRHGEFALSIVLPKQRNGLAAVEQALTTELLATWLADHTTKKLALKLPRFRIDPPQPLLLSPLLRKLGLEDALDPGSADFSGIAPAAEQLFISEGFHKAFIDVDEEGTEAAAATALGMRAGAAPMMEEPIPFVADHPFVFVLHDRATGAVLFIGRMVDPRPATG